MTSIVTILTEGFADWETALLNAAARSYYGVTTRYATPGGAPVTSAGGLRVTPDLALERLDPGQYDALVVCGGSAWAQPDAPDLGGVLGAARQADKVIGLICDGTVAAARTGLLDRIAHTSNGVGHLDGTGYAGAGHYVDVPYAVTDGKVITAAGTAPVSFMVAVFEALGLGGDDLKFYAGLYGAEHAAKKQP